MHSDTCGDCHKRESCLDENDKDVDVLRLGEPDDKIVGRVKSFMTTNAREYFPHPRNNFRGNPRNKLYVWSLLSIGYLLI